MTPDLYRKAGDVFNQVRDLPDSELPNALDAACAGNSELREQALLLIEADRHASSGSFLGRRALEDAARLIPPETPALPADGTVIGNYRLGAQIGAGGMGIVYEAQDLHLDRRVAIKILPLTFASEAAEKIQRFQREARAASTLNHPNIVSIIDAGFDKGYYYITMELVEGKTLRQLATSQSPGLDSKAVLDLIGQTASALGAAHDAGFVHRDIKPENIMVRSDGIIKVLDFGLAKLRERSDPVTGPDLLTRPGKLAGTIQYLSPEQILGKPAGPRSDLFSLGVVAYELATGVRPFDGPTDGAIFDAILNRAPAPPSSLRPILGAETDSLILRLLEKDPELRFQTAFDLRSACKLLSRDPSGLSSLSAPARARVRGPSAFWKPIAILLLIALIAVLWAPWRSAVQETGRTLVQLDLDVGEEVSHFALSPDGMQLALVMGNRLAMRRLDNANITPLEGTDGASFPFFSADGQWVAFFAGRKLQKIAVTGGAPVVLCDAPSARGGSWGDDGNIVATLSSTGGLFRIPASGGTPQLFSDVQDDGHGLSGYRWPQVLPGGKGVLFITNVAGGAFGSIKSLSARDRKVRTLIEHSAYGRYLGAEHMVYFQHGRLFTVRIDLDHMRLTGAATPLVDGVASDTFRGAIFESSLAGTLVYRRVAPGSNAVLSWMDSTGHAEPIPAPDGPYLSPRLSPDGKKLALAMADESQQNLWVYDLDRKTMSRLTFDAEPRYLPVWTPDGEFVLFRSGADLGWTRADGSGKMERLAVPGIDPMPASFSPDGKWLVLAANRPPTGWDIWIAPAERTSGTLKLGTPRPYLTQAGGQYAPAISPDGRWIVYTSDESGRPEIYVAPFAPEGPPRSGRWQVSNAGGVYPLWSHDGRQVFYRSMDRHVMAAECMSRGELFSVGPPRAWASRRLDPAAGFPSFDLAPNGKVAGIFEFGQPNPETHLRVLLNVNDELRRREKNRGGL